MFPFTPAIAAVGVACLSLAPTGAGRPQREPGAGAPAASGIPIAILDTGVARLPPLLPSLDRGYDFVANTSRTTDANGHGTAIASIAAGHPDPKLGVAGVCASCTIVPVRIAGASGIGTAALAADGIRWSVAHGARVINFSLTSTAADPELTLAIADATSQGVVVVLAAGNGGSSDPESNGYPAAVSPEALTVGGVDPSGQLFPWSNRGSWVRFAAPGTELALTRSGAVTNAEGTSVAAAYVSGVVGLMLSANPSLTPERVSEILAETGTPEPGLDVASGRLVNSRAAVAAATAG